MSTDFSDSVQKAARLRAEMTRLEVDAPRQGLVGRVWEGVVDCLMLAVLLVLAIDGWLAYRAFHDQPDAPAPDSGAVTGAPMSGWPSS